MFDRIFKSYAEALRICNQESSILLSASVILTKQTSSEWALIENGLPIENVGGELAIKMALRQIFIKEADNQLSKINLIKTWFRLMVKGR